MWNYKLLWQSSVRLSSNVVYEDFKVFKDAKHMKEN